MATGSTVINGLGPRVAFSTDVALFTSGHGPDGDDDWVSMRVMVAELAHAQWGFIAAEMHSTSLPEFLEVIDEAFWFEANEVAGIIQVARQSRILHGGWRTYQFKFTDAIDFADCMRAIAEAKSQVLYRRMRMIDGFIDVFQQQFQQEADRTSAQEEVSRSPSVTAGDVGENRDVSASLPQLGPTAAADLASLGVAVPADLGYIRTTLKAPDDKLLASLTVQHVNPRPSPSFSSMLDPDRTKSSPPSPSGKVLPDHIESSPPSPSGMDFPNHIEVIIPGPSGQAPTVQYVTGVFLSISSLILRAIIAAFAGSVGVVCFTIRLIVRASSFLALPLVAFLAGLFMVSFVSFGTAALWRSAQAAMMSFDVCKLPMICSTSGLPSLNVCNLPFIPAVIPHCATLPVATVGRADFAGLLAIQHRTFDELVAGSTTNSELVVNVKHAELAIRDLVVLVKASNLTTKEPLADTLSSFSVDARRTGRGLQLLMSKIHGTIDSTRIIAYNAYALRVIDTAYKKGDTCVDATVLHTFQISMASFSASISAIVAEATSVWADLDLLEERLLTIHALCVHEALDTAFAKDELLWQLWTLLGGNRCQLRELANRASILQSVQEYRALASAYVAATVQALSVVDADLIELRDELGVQASAHDSIPVEMVSLLALRFVSLTSAFYMRIKKAVIPHAGFAGKDTREAMYWSVKMQTFRSLLLRTSVAIPGLDGVPPETSSAAISETAMSVDPARLAEDGADDVDGEEILAQAEDSFMTDSTQSRGVKCTIDEVEREDAEAPRELGRSDEDEASAEARRIPRMCSSLKVRPDGTVE
ncbi:hypothetical protein GSI_10976 [Ganoderma sinense ZZ0214-1]|uniref:Uncharacterized protein n=1 Tax=Ganoderma sinense ZZ0214-1 TaxID=1077348 RepID=A0A2G8S243_9APHY|nr:hypothetical protein GSI_10976 [Ganoderma sinense ZZ0214-1]